MKKTVIALLIITAASTISCKKAGDSLLPLPPANDKTSPTFSAVPATGSTMNSLSDVTITFSEPVSNASDISSYGLEGPGTGSLSIASVLKVDDYTYTVMLAGDAGNGALFFTLADITDSSGNPLSGNTILYTIDTENPTAAADPASGSRVASLAQVDLTYSKPVGGADNVSNYILSGAGMGSLSISGAISIGGNTYRLTLTGDPGDGPVLISINDIADMIGNPLAGASIAYIADNTPPSCTSQPVGGDRLNSLDEVFVTFSEPVLGATSSTNYVISGSGAGSLGIGSVGHYMDNTYRVVFTGSIGNGDVQMQMNNIQDLLGNPLSNDTLVFTGDLANPTQFVNPSDGAYLVSLNYIDITYSKAVLNADVMNNYILSGSGASSLSITGVSLQSGTTYRLFLAGSVSTGPVTLTINDVTDLAGNPLLDNRVSYAGDIQPPSHTADPSDGSHINGLSSVVITFSEPVLNASSLSNYSVSGSGVGGLSIVSVNPLSGTMYQVNLTGTPVNGSLNLQMQNISDSAGNALADNTIQYQVDTINPTFTTVPSGGSFVRSLLYLDITFSKQVEGADEATGYSLSGTGLGSLAVQSAAHRSGNTYRVYFTGEPGNGTVTVTMSGITDDAGNPPSSATITFNADAVPPTQTSVEQNGSAVAQVPQIDITFSEPVSGAATTSHYSLSGAGRGTLSLISAALLTGTTYRLTFTGTPYSGYTMTLTMTGITDTAGNHLLGNTISYTIDQVNPTRTANPASGSTIRTLSQVTITYSEVVFNADNPANYAISGPGIGTLAITGVTHLSGNVYQLSLTGAPVDGAVSITISNVIDSAGNPLNGNVISYSGDFTGPSVSSTFPSAGATSMGTDTIIQIIFSENVDPATINSTNITVHNGSGYLTGTLTCWGRHIFFSPSGYTLTPGATITVRATTGVADLVGNSLAADYEFSFSTGSSTSANLIPESTPSAYSSPEQLTAAGNYIFFSGYLSGYGDELCAYNIVANTTALVKDIYYDPIWPTTGCDLDYLTEMNGILYFSAHGYNDYGLELWKSNGTNGGTVRITDISPGTISSSPRYPSVMGSSLFFVANNMSNHPDLYVTDGTSPAQKLISISYGSVIKSGSDLTPGNGLLFFECIGPSGCELYKTDGTTSGTVIVKDINPGTLSSYPAYLAFCNNVLYFAANDGTHGHELWKSDGTDAGTVSVRDINLTGSSTPDQITGVGSDVFFIADDGVHGEELWISDGTEVGTTLVADITPGSSGSTLSNLTACNGYLFFINDADGSLWRSDGTESGTVRIKSFDAEKIIMANNTLYIIAVTTAFGREIWKSDGTEEGTFLLTDIAPGTGTSAMGELIEYNGRLYFTAWKSGIGTKIWWYQ